MTAMTHNDIEVALLRHCEKYPSTHSDLRLANQPTEEGLRASRTYGASLCDFDEVVIVTSSEDRAVMTGREIGTGYLEVRPDGILTIQGPNPALAQMVPERLRQEYKSGRMTRADLTEQCYAMVLPQAQGGAQELGTLKTAADSYMSVAMQYFAEASPQHKKAVVLVGHDPHVGSIEQLLEPTAAIAELRPLDKITFTRTPEGIQYAFTNNTVTYQGVMR